MCSFNNYILSSDYCRKFECFNYWYSDCLLFRGEGSESEAGMHQSKAHRCYLCSPAGPVTLSCSVTIFFPFPSAPLAPSICSTATASEVSPDVLSAQTLVVVSSCSCEFLHMVESCHLFLERVWHHFWSRWPFQHVLMYETDVLRIWIYCLG